MYRLVPVGATSAAILILGLSGASIDERSSAQSPARPTVPPDRAAPKPPGPPRSLSVTAGRGEAVLFAMDELGRRIVLGKPDRRGRKLHVVPKEEARTLRWAVVVGTVDLGAIRAASPPAPPGATPWWPCRRVDLERQVRGDLGDWSDWGAVDFNANLTILDNLTEVEAERIAEEVRPDVLVDPLPFLKSGTWRGVDVESLVDPAHRDIPRRALNSAPAGPKRPGRSPDEVMFRSIDFTVRPGASYRYRARWVADPPETVGPWSDATPPVTIPAE